MNDLEITRLCATAMGIQGAWQDIAELHPWDKNDPEKRTYDPFHDDAQAMALVKKFGLQIEAGDTFSIAEGGDWSVFQPEPKRWEKGGKNWSDSERAHHADLNRAICECVSKMESAK